MIWTSTDLLIEVSDDAIYVEMNDATIYVGLDIDGVHVEVNGFSAGLADDQGPNGPTT